MEYLEIYYIKRYYVFHFITYIHWLDLFIKLYEQ